ncbi:MAG: M20 family metallopeptidase [Anaerolineales bacterium]|nr:M20 family metallopeptidase [Anaerolineales bacterium]
MADRLFEQALAVYFFRLLRASRFASSNRSVTSSPMDSKALLKKLVETESPSHDPAAVNCVADLVIAEARQLGAEIQTLENQIVGKHVVAKWGSGAENFLFLCHMDTVFPIGTLQSMPYREADGKIFGPGVLDMKAGIAICLSAIAELQKINSLNRSITLLCTSDEEIGSDSSRKHIEELARQAQLVLVFEAALPDGALKTWRKGVGHFHLEARGRAAHAGGDHAQGRNAIEEIAHQTLALQKLTDYAKQTTLNVGVIRGGTTSNVVPNQASIEVDVRVLQPDEWTRIEAEVNRLQPVLDGTALQITGQLNRPPMPFDHTMQTTFAKAKNIAARIGMELKAGGTGGGSDGNFVAALGVPVLDGMGAVGEGYHSEREFIYADSLAEKKNLLVELIKRW